MIGRCALVLLLSTLALPALAGPKEWKGIRKAAGKGDCAKVLQLAPTAFGASREEPRQLEAVKAVADCVINDVKTAAPPPLPGEIRLAAAAFHYAPPRSVDDQRGALVNAVATRMVALQQAGDVNAAIAIADALLAVAPDDPSVHMLRLGAYGQSGDWSLGATELAWVMDTWEQIPKRQHVARNQLLAVGAQSMVLLYAEVEDAEALFERAETLAESTGDAALLREVRAYRFTALANNGLPRREVLDRMLAAEPDDPNLQKVDVLLVAEDEPETAAPRLVAYLKDHPDDLDVHFNLGALYMTASNRAAQEQLDLDPRDPRADQLGALILAEQEKAWPHFAKVAENPEHPARLLAVQQLKRIALLLEKNEEYARYKQLEQELQGGR